MCAAYMSVWTSALESCVNCKGVEALLTQNTEVLPNLLRSSGELIVPAGYCT